jgi:AcrR family transcriptional regulator
VGLVDGRGGSRLSAYIGHDGLPANLCGDGFGAIGIDVCDCHRRSGQRQQLGSYAPAPVPPADHERLLTLQTKHVLAVHVCHDRSVNPTSTSGSAAAGTAVSEVTNGPRSRKGVQTRARLVDAAKQIFEENGFLEARISDIAERAGLSHGSFYHYFDSKEQIFQEVVASLDERLSEPMYSVVLHPAPGTTAFDRLFEAIRAHLASYRDEARIMGVIEQVSRYNADVALTRSARRERYGNDVTQSIRRMQRRGVADGTLDPVVAAAALGAMTERFTEAMLVDKSVECSVDEAARVLATLYVNALKIKDEPGEAPRRRGRSAAG